ncbi:MAG TPA: SDR family NAD(P)-dependent oxidoreductase [Acidimicrobiales bacterium]
MGTITLTPDTGVIVTGGGSGIGRATAFALAEAGRPVAVWDVNGEAAARVADEIAAQHGVATVGLAVDVCDTPAFGKAIDASRAAMGTIGGLVHAAGIVGAAPVDALDEQVWDATLGTHLRAGALLIRDLVADLEGNPGSAIVLIASIEAIVAHEAIVSYCSAKAGMLGLARSSAARLAKRGIRVNAVCPGFIDTPMFSPSVQAPGALETYVKRIPLARLGRPEDIARAVRFLLSDDAAYITATEMVVDGGVTRTTF